MDIDTRQTICRLVAGIVIADDILEDHEEKFLDRLLSSFGMDSGRDAVFPLADRDEAAEKMKALPKDAQDEAMRLLIEAACIDGQIAPEERDYLRAVAAAIEMPLDAVARRVADQLGKSTYTLD
jgi:tellurite resistance protein